MVSSFGLVRPHQYIMTYTRLCRSEFLKPVKTDSLTATTITKTKTNKNWQISQLAAIKLLLITDHGASLLHKGFGIICLFACLFVIKKSSSSCEASCRFIGHLTTTSLVNGDGSPVPLVRTPTVTKKTLNSIHLEWDAVKPNKGTPVYLIRMTYTGDWPTSRDCKRSRKCEKAYTFDHVCMTRSMYDQKPIT